MAQNYAAMSLTDASNHDGLSGDSSASEFGCGSYHCRESLPESGSSFSSFSFDTTEPARPPSLDDAIGDKSALEKSTSLCIFKSTISSKWGNVRI